MIVYRVSCPSFLSFWIWTGEGSWKTEEDSSPDPGGTGEGPAGMSSAGDGGVLRVEGEKYWE